MQTVTSSPEAEQLPASRPPLRAIALGLGVAVVLLIVMLLTLRSVRPNVLPRTELDGEPVGGMTRSQLTATATQMAGQHAGDLITFASDTDRRTATNATVGNSWDVEATVEAIWRRGRQGNPFAALADHVRASFDTVTMRPVQRTDRAMLDRWVDGVMTALGTPPVEGNLRFIGTQVQRRNPSPGSRPTAESVRSATRAALVTAGSDTPEYEVEQVAPMTSVADVDRLVDIAETVVSAPVELSRGDESVSLDPETLAGLFTVDPVRAGNDDLRLELVVDGPSLAEVFSADVIERFTVDARDATVVLVEGGPRVENGRQGFAVNLAKVADQIAELATTPAAEGAPRRAELAGDVTKPDRTTEEAKDLQITQRVSSFTTEHQCCQGRVANIHRFADLMDGVVIEPEKTFSLNAHVGPRTAAKGFVSGGAIQEGEYVEEVGGGVSQFATTFFNAAFFGGYEILEHKPHSYYISRYPVGRESTINYPNVDVKIRNDSPYGILVDTSYTGTSITVTFWGRKWVEVDSATGEPYNHTSPQTQYRDNAALPKGSEQVVQSGGNGFDVVVTRELRYDDGRTETEEYATRYLAEPRIVERGTGE